MERVYKARFFNGQSSLPYTADVFWQDDGLLIQYTNAKNEWQQIHWQKQAIEKTEFNNSIVTLRYGSSFPQQQLEVTDIDFISRYKSTYNVGLMHKFKLRSTTLLISLVACIALGVWLCYIFLLPAIANYGASVFPKEYEIELGEKLYESILQGEKIDSAKTIAINHFFKQLNITTDYPIKITVVKSEIVNAFALPGGGIVVYDAILNNMQSADQLAALLSHEFSHVQLKHATRNMFRSLAGYIFISVIFSDVNGIAGVLVENAHQLRNLNYSRELETEADNNGLLILSRSKISVNGMKALFELLKKQSHDIEVSELISTHPDLDNRIKNVDEFLRDNPYQFVYNDSLVKYFNQLKNDTTWID